MKIHAYRLEQRGPRRFEDLAQTIHALPFEDRLFLGEDDGLRLEHYEVVRGLVYLDFARERSGHGPGRMPRAARMVDIDIGDDRFGEDTAMVYDPISRYAALQYNHVGPRSNAIRNYMFAADLANGLQAASDDVPAEERCGYDFGSVLRPDAYERLRRFGFIQRIEFKISLPGVQAGDMAAGRSLGSILHAPLPEGAEKIHVSVSARSTGSLGRREAVEMVDDLRALGANVLSGKVWAKETEDDRRKPIDLVEDQLSGEAEIAAGRGRRFALPERLHALARALTEWRASGQLP